MASYQKKNTKDKPRNERKRKTPEVTDGSDNNEDECMQIQQFERKDKKKRRRTSIFKLKCPNKNKSKKQSSMSKKCQLDTKKCTIGVQLYTNWCTISVQLVYNRVQFMYN